MAVTKLSNSGIKTGVLKYDSMLAGNAAYDPAATWLIQRVAGTGSAGTITFSSIPQTYQHLQLRVNCMSTTNGASLVLRFNSDSSANYTRHLIAGNGTSVLPAGTTGQTAALAFGWDIGIANATYMSVAIIDIHDYKSTTKNKTMRAFSGIDKNGTGEVDLHSALWLNTSAITSIDVISFTTGSWTTSSTFALYGYKGA